MLAKQKEFDGFNVTFNTNEDCNLACTYCYEVNKKQRVLDFDYAKRFIDLILTEEDPIGVTGTQFEWILQRGLVLDFIGGDSLMHPELVDSILMYYVKKSRQLNHRWADRWRASLSTNGTLFGNKKVQYLLEKWKNVFSVGVSVDGCPEIHDKNRIYLDGRGSMAEIRKWWPWFTAMFPSDGLSTKSTLSKASIPYIYESLVFLHEEMGIKYVNQNFIMENMGLEQSDYEKLEEQLELGINYLIKHKDDLHWGLLEADAKIESYEKTCAIRPNTGWCGSGAMPALSVDGNIYPCFRFLPHTQEKDGDLMVGNVFDGFSKKANFSVVREQTREKISPIKCKSCPIESICSWCIGGAYSEKKEFFRPTYTCDINKLRADYSKKYWEMFHSLQSCAV